MIQLYPNRTYAIRYSKGTVHEDGDLAYFRTFDSIPEAKHLIIVKDLTTGKIVNLVDLLAHPWNVVEEHNGPLPKPKGVERDNPLRAIIPFFAILWRKKAIFATT